MGEGQRQRRKGEAGEGGGGQGRQLGRRKCLGGSSIHLHMCLPELLPEHLEPELSRV